MPEEHDINQQIRERFSKLPKVIQDAITSTDVSQRMRRMADAYDLHLDQWELLENEVHLALLGFSPMEKLAENIRREVGVREEVANKLADDITKEIFEPVREELERELEHPEAEDEKVTSVEAARRNAIAAEGAEARAAAPGATPATPPEPAPETKAERGPASGAYVPGVASSERKDVVDDPYRETPV